MDTLTIRSNLVVLRGAMTNDPTRRELPSGAVVAQFDIATPLWPSEQPANVSVPVSWADPPVASARWLVPGDQFVVIGTVRRRFFGVGGATQSRTEVVADHVIPARRAKTAQRAIDAAVASLSP
jgi:single-strand DNA-binding protein